MHDLANEFSKMGISHVTFDHPANEIKEGFDFIVSHGLWQWPGLHSLTLKKEKEDSIYRLSSRHARSLV